MKGTGKVSIPLSKPLSLILIVAVCGFPIQRAEGQTCTRLTTFNTALLPRMDAYTERRELISNALIQEDADVLFLQEVWFERDVKKIIEETRDVYPYHYSDLPPRPRNSWFRRLTTATTCSFLDRINFYLRVFICGLANQCLAEFNIDFARGLACATQNCKSGFQSVSPDCVSCVALTATSIGNLMGGCTRADEDNRLNPAGLLLLSKKPFTSVEYKNFFPGKDMTLPRGYFQAEIDGLPPLLFTHLSSLFPVYFEYELEWGSYVLQQQEEIRLLNGVYGNADHIVVGDMNTGPEVADQVGERRLYGEAPENYQMLLDLGYKSPYMDQDGRCTFCDSNPLRTDVNNKVIDHFMPRADSTATFTSERVLDSYQEGTPLSDHFGVRTTICT